MGFRKDGFNFWGKRLFRTLLQIVFELFTYKSCHFWLHHKQLYYYALYLAHPEPLLQMKINFNYGSFVVCGVFHLVFLFFADFLLVLVLGQCIWSGFYIKKKKNHTSNENQFCGKINFVVSWWHLKIVTVLLPVVFFS